MKALAAEFEDLSEHYKRRGKDVTIREEERLICLGRCYAYADAARQMRELGEANAS